MTNTKEQIQALLNDYAGCRADLEAIVAAYRKRIPDDEWLNMNYPLTGEEARPVTSEGKPIFGGGSAWDVKSYLAGIEATPSPAPAMPRREEV